MKEYINILKKHLFITKYIYKNSPFFAVFNILMQPINAFISVFTYTYSLKFIIDSIEIERGIGEIIGFLAILLCANLVIRLTDAILEKKITPIAQEKLKSTMQLEIFAKTKGLDLEFYDDVEFYNQFMISFSQSNERIIAIFNDMLSFLKTLCTLIYIMILIFTMHYAMLILIGVAVIFSVIVNLKIVNLTKARTEKLVLPDRKAEYVKRVFYLLDYAKDIKTTNISKVLTRNFLNHNAETKEIYNEYSKKLFLLNFINQYVINYFLLLFLLPMMFIFFFYQSITYGSFAIMISVTNQFRQNMLDLISFFTKLSENYVFICGFQKFMALESKIVDKENAKTPPKDISDIEIKNMDFAYQGSDRTVIKNMNLTLNKGEKIAVVGYNGAGKSTFTNLLLRLYEPTRGEIKLGGVNIKDYKVKEYRDKFKVSFQKFQIYATSVGRNISMNTEKISKEEDIFIKKSLEKLNFSIKNIDLKSSLTKEFNPNGLVLSGGNQQKLAIARILYGNGDYIILDEPSSALDPIAENLLMDTIQEIFKDQTVILITHRLSIAKRADRILVMEDGKVTEDGTHEELVENEKLYSKMYLLQSKKYAD